MEYSRPAFSAVAIGGAISFVAQVTFLILGAGIGLSGLAAGVFALAVIAGSFLAAGYIASYLASQARRGASFLHALGAWAFVETAVMILISTNLLGWISPLFQRAELQDTAALSRFAWVSFATFAIGAAAAWLGCALEWRTRPHVTHQNVHRLQRKQA